MGYTCPVCNYDRLFKSPYSKNGSGSYEICPCCGFQFGYDDYPNKEETQVKWRKNWIRDKYPWYSKTRLPPDDWNPKKQIGE